MAEKFLQKAGIDFEKVYADENPALAEQYGVHQAPTLVVNGEKIVNLSNIKAFTEQTQSVK